MNKTIQPTQYDVAAKCACGATYNTRSTVKDIKMTLCSACHPYFTGQQKFVDVAGRIEKFEKKYGPKK